MAFIRRSNEKIIIVFPPRSECAGTGRAWLDEKGWFGGREAT
jgi:hypothetical protein